MANGRLIGLVIGGVALGAAAVGIVAMVDDGPSPSDASTPASAYPAQDTGSDGVLRRTITVSGQGTATGTPDTARIWLGVEAQADTANEALDSANENAQTLLDTLEGFGVDEADVQTSNISLYPRYDNAGRTIVGYTASNDLNVVVRNLDELGRILDAAAGFVGDEIRFGGVSLYVDDTDALQGDARADAIGDAKRRADEYAAAAGVSVGQVLSISEVSTPIAPGPYYEYAAADSAGSSEVPIAVGSQEVSVSVTVVYEIA